ncbi:BREX-1 system phosphatase PglZ type A [Anoxynatronum buryatiense]|uniref:TIGR02687 family protein n=1 Tax=Anoxynatronum buryatiense TaxID=489973 RepID=A0AA45WZE5_9CLOT|nr:BREX-1 system phosphatase PglZ type A [Anoxynatronum buryatiense]SMP72043.1 TIGR02687 family protein [Anoxynatronum buryatiense]
MNLIEIKKILEGHYQRDPHAEGHRNIVFWYDEAGEFEKDIEQLDLEKAEIVTLTDHNSFAVKYRLEVEEPERDFLLYSNRPKPLTRDNWLLDTLKYSIEFSADKAVLIMRDFGVMDESMLPAFRKHLKFFDNKERYRKLASYELERITEEGLEIAILSVLCKLSMPDLEHVVRRVLVGELEKSNKVFEEITKYGDSEAFWRLMKKYYGYNSETRSLEGLLVTLLTTHMSHQIELPLPVTWQPFVSNKRSNCVVLVSNFMSHAMDGEQYRKLADRVQSVLKLVDYLETWELEKILPCDTFRAIDIFALKKLTHFLVEGLGEFQKYREIIGKRKTTHWANEVYAGAYELVLMALELFSMEKDIEPVMLLEHPGELLEAYTKTVYRMDRFYRKYWTACDRLAEKEWMAELSERVENTYANWFLNQLSVKWSKSLEGTYTYSRKIPSTYRQLDFYRDWVKPHVEKQDRIFVIISDALRYEVGHELMELLNTEIRGATSLDWMEGVVPSTTKLGMAALLPREIGEKMVLDASGDLQVGGISTQGTENRQTVLKKHVKDALALSYNQLADMKRADYKEAFEGRKLVYLYHNTIDALGDKAATERQVFEGVDRALQELVQLVRNLVNHISATRILITADHGFLYQRSPLQEASKMTKHSVNVLEEGRRYLLMDDEEIHIEGLNIPLEDLFGKETKLKAVVPKGLIRYKMPGPGANYVHGGASLQEMILPVVQFKNIRNDTFKASKVEVRLTSITRKITNRITYLEFFQTDLVEAKKTPMKLKIYFEDEIGNRISNENIVIADSMAKEPAKRTHREKFTLKDMAYDKTKKYYLILEDEEESVEKIVERISFTIDLLISDDFGL